jgi:bifunctional non-homologous end joining protein LigD
MPDLVPPMQAVAGELPAGPEWAVEFAWEGLRCIAYAAPGRLRLLTAASDRDVTGSFPELVGPLTGAVPRRGAVLDGTVVALGDGGFPRRRLLQARSATARPSEALVRRTPVGFFVGDLLWLDGRSTVELPYRRRRELLAGLGLASPAVVSPSFPLDDVGFVLRAAEQHGVDALHAKHLEAPYRPGRRSRLWLRVPTSRTRQVAVGGWTPADPRRPDSVAALLLGVPAGGAHVDTAAGLRYVGRVGIGSGAAHRELAALLPGLRRDTSPFTGPLPAAAQRGGQWVEPALVGIVEFAGWTADGRLRLPLWRGALPGEEADPRWWAQPPEAVVPAASEDSAPPEPEDPAHPEPEKPGPPERPSPEPDRVALRRLEQHFVYNSLNTIASLVRTDPTRARELLLGFADLTRATDQPPDATSTLGHELAAVRAYLQLEQARFGKRLRVDVAVDPALHAVPVPPTAVLAAVRATVQQRIEPRPEGGTLALHAEPTGGGCVIRIAADGTGEPTLIQLGGDG